MLVRYFKNRIHLVPETDTEIDLLAQFDGAKVWIKNGLSTGDFDSLVLEKNEDKPKK